MNKIAESISKQVWGSLEQLFVQKHINCACKRVKDNLVQMHRCQSLISFPEQWDKSDTAIYRNGVLYNATNTSVSITNNNHKLLC